MDTGCIRRKIIFLIIIWTGSLTILRGNEKKSARWTEPRDKGAPLTTPARGREAVRASNSPELDETKRDGTRRHQVCLEPERLTPAAAPHPDRRDEFSLTMTATHTARKRPVRRNNRDSRTRARRVVTETRARFRVSFILDAFS